MKDLTSFCRSLLSYQLVECLTSRIRWPSNHMAKSTSRGHPASHPSPGLGSWLDLYRCRNTHTFYVYIYVHIHGHLVLREIPLEVVPLHTQKPPPCAVVPAVPFYRLALRFLTHPRSQPQGEAGPPALRRSSCRPSGINGKAGNVGVLGESVKLL